MSHKIQDRCLQLWGKAWMGNAIMKMKKFVHVGNLVNKSQKNLQNKNISNPYGNLYRRRKSISCPSSPSRINLQPTGELLGRVAEILNEPSSPDLAAENEDTGAETEAFWFPSDHHIETGEAGIIITRWSGSPGFLMITRLIQVRKGS